MTPILIMFFQPENMPQNDRMATINLNNEKKTKQTKGTYNHFPQKMCIFPSALT